jgi:putative PIG3 family NAD(P)H quinone oxidoreductase
MRQIQIQTDGSLSVEMVSIPIPKGDEVLIKVKAIGINRADILQRQGLYPSENSINVPGLEISGIIEGINKRVCALLPAGGYSEFVVVKQNHLIFLPNQFDLIQAATLPEALATCWMALFDQAKLKKNQNVIVHGGSSGIGSFVIQIAKAYNCNVFASMSDPKKFEFCKQIGADFCFNYKENNFASRIKELGGADIIIDILGGKYLTQNLKCLNKYGKLISLAVMTGANAEVNLGSILMKNTSIIGATLRSQPDSIKSNYIKKVSKFLLPLVISNKVQPIIDSIYKFEEADLAHKRMIERKHKGKLLLVI